MKGKREIIEEKRVGFKMSFLKLRLLSNGRLTNGLELTIEIVHLRWNFIYTNLIYDDGLEVEGQGTCW